MARENCPNLGGRQRLVDFHARTARIGKNNFDILTFQRFDEDVPAKFGLADFGAFPGSIGF